MLPVISGVPQGSVLGPRLFLIKSPIRVHWIVLCHSLPTTSPCIDASNHLLTSYWKVQLDINTFVDWICQQCLSLQPAKCCYMLVSRKRTSSLPPPILYVSGTPLQRVTSVRYLGVELTQDLSWSLHVAILLMCQSQTAYWVTLPSFLQAC